MKKLLRISVFFTFLFGLIGLLNSLNFVNIEKISTNSMEKSTYPYDFSSEISLESSHSFHLSVKIPSENLIFFRSSDLESFFSEMDFEDFAEIFSEIDGVWWELDLWDDEIIDELGEDFVKFLRDFIESLNDYEESELKILENSYNVDGISVKIRLDFFDSPFNLPEEYEDFSNFFAKSFEK